MTRENRPRVGVGVLFLRSDRVFLAKRQGSHAEAHWGFAGGHLEFGETLEDCAKREAFEEFGVHVSNLRFLCVSNIIAYDRHYVDIEFIGDIGEQMPEIMERDKFSESGWFCLGGLPNPLFQPAARALESLRSGEHYFSSEGFS